MTPAPNPTKASAARGVAIVVAAVALMLGVHGLPNPANPAPLERSGDIIALTTDGKACLAVLAFAITLWVTEAVPFAVTSLFVLVLIPVLGITDYETSCAPGSATRSSPSSSGLCVTLAIVGVGLLR